MPLDVRCTSHSTRVKLFSVDDRPGKRRHDGLWNNNSCRLNVAMDCVPVKSQLPRPPPPPGSSPRANVSWAIKIEVDTKENRHYLCFAQTETNWRDSTCEPWTIFIRHRLIECNHSIALGIRKITQTLNTVQIVSLRYAIFQPEPHDTRKPGPQQQSTARWIRRFGNGRVTVRVRNAEPWTRIRETRLNTCRAECCIMLYARTGSNFGRSWWSYYHIVFDWLINLSGIPIVKSDRNPSIIIMTI